MKIANRSLKAPREDFLALPREGEEDIIFKARVIDSYEDFEKLCPPPQVPKILYKGEQVARENTEDAEYKVLQAKWLVDRQNWLILKSLDATPGLEWETVDRANPATWNNYINELKESGFNVVETILIRNLALGVNSVTQDKLDEARKRFLASQRPAASSQ